MIILAAFFRRGALIKRIHGFISFSGSWRAPTMSICFHAYLHHQLARASRKRQILQTILFSLFFITFQILLQANYNNHCIFQVKQISRISNRIFAYLSKMSRTLARENVRTRTIKYYLHSYLLYMCYMYKTFLNFSALMRHDCHECKIILVYCCYTL